MIRVLDWRAALSVLPAGMDGADPRLHITGMLQTRKTASACARYAEVAFRDLAPEPADLGMVCLCGHTGTTSSAFDKAKQLAEDGRLTGNGFGTSRHKRIHPFTLVRSLQNQVPAMLSMNFGITGPVLNALDSTTAVPHLLANMTQMNQTHTLLVIAAAAFREEEASKQRLIDPAGEGIEGAVIFLLGKSDGIGSWTAAEPPSPARSPMTPPVLAAGLALMQPIANGADDALIAFTDPDRYTTAIRWRRN